MPAGVLWPMADCEREMNRSGVLRQWWVREAGSWWCSRGREIYRERERGGGV